MIEHEGKKYARVSDILRPFCDFSNIDPQVLSNKSKIGTAVHEAIADDIAGRFPCLNSDSVGYFDSYEGWKRRLEPAFIKSEVRYFDDSKMLTGQIDALALLSGVDGLPTLIDFKTSAQESKDTWLMQAHLYAYLLSKNDIRPHQRSLFIKLDKHGGLPQVFQYFWRSDVHAKCMKAIDDFWSSQTK